MNQTQSSAAQTNPLYPGMFDALKGWCVLSIIITHHGGEGLFSEASAQWAAASAWNSFLEYLYLLLVHYIILIPLLVTLGGFGFRPMPFKLCLKKQTRLLIKPYVITGLITAVLKFIAHCALFRDPAGAVAATISVLGAYGIGLSAPVEVLGFTFYTIGPIWYLLMLFFAWQILNAILYYAPKRLVPGLLGLCMVCWYVVEHFGLQHISIFLAPLYVVYLYIGYQIRERNLLTKDLPPWKWTVIIAFAVYFLRYTWKGTPLPTSLLGIIVEETMYRVGGVCTIFLLMRFSLWLNRFQFPLRENLCTVGRYAPWFMCLHSVEYVVCFWWVWIEKLNAHFSVGMVYIITLFLRGLVIYLGFRLLLWWNAYKSKSRKRRKQRASP